MKKKMQAGKFGLVCALGLGLGLLAANAARAAEARWWKGNLHTHSLWSDGDHYPEVVVDWYHEHGYDFLALSDHNITLTGEKWIDATTNKGGAAALEAYIKRFGTNWVERRVAAGRSQVRLKTLQEFRGMFESRGKFLLIPAEEITDHYLVLPVHMCVSNLRDLIEPQHGTNVADVLQRNVDAVLEQRKRTGQPMIPHINHPNFGWALTAEDIMGLRGEKFFEVYNGHPIVRNEGDEDHASTERIWDIILTKRLAEMNLEPIWGTAVDDAHSYLKISSKESNPGRGWIVVRCAELKPASLIAAMEAGDFYASSGVCLTEVRREKGKLSVEIQPEEGVTYTTQFIGTRRGYYPKSEPVRKKDGSPFPATRKYSEDIGRVLAEVKGTSPSYTFKGDEIYVRAKVVSSKLKTNPYQPGEHESAWVQPVVGNN